MEPRINTDEHGFREARGREQREEINHEGHEAGIRLKKALIFLPFVYFVNFVVNSY